MRIRVPLIVASAVIGAAVAGVAVSAPNGATAATPRVQINDNDGPLASQGSIDYWTGHWSFAPQHVTVMKGEAVIFDNPAGNFRPHNVVSISNSGMATAPVLESGAKFTSGLANESWLRPGSTWTLDTNAVDAGHYSYFCSLHPWMVGSITVMQP